MRVKNDLILIKIFLKYTKTVKTFTFDKFSDFFIIFKIIVSKLFFVALNNLIINSLANNLR